MPEDSHHVAHVHHRRNAQASDNWFELCDPDVEVIDGDDKVVVRQRRDLRGKSRGVEVKYDYWLVLTFRNGKAVRAEYFDARREALEAAGLRE